MKLVRVLIAVALVGAMAFTAVGCKPSNVAARVNGEEIAGEELDKQVEQLKKTYPQMFEGPDSEGRLLDFKQRLLDNLINQELMRQAAKAKNISVSDSEVKEQIKQLRGQFKDEAQFEQAISSAGMNTDTLEAQIREQLLTQRLVESLAADSEVSDEEIKKYYDDNKQNFFQQAAKRPSHILFKPEDKKQAEQALKELKDGADFKALAKKYSVDTATAAKGGDLGWPSTPLVPEFQAAVDKLKKGETSSLVQSPYGWHIIMVTDERKGSQKKLADVENEVEQLLVQQRRSDAYQKFLTDLRDKATIEIVDAQLKEGAALKTEADTKPSDAEKK